MKTAEELDKEWFDKGSTPEARKWSMEDWQREHTLFVKQIIDATLEHAAEVKMPFPKISHPIEQELFEAGLEAKTKAILAERAKIK